MYCKNKFCIFQKDSDCTLKEISISETGQCVDCRMVSVDDNSFSEEKEHERFCWGIIDTLEDIGILDYNDFELTADGLKFNPKAKERIDLNQKLAAYMEERGITAAVKERFPELFDDTDEE